MAYLPLLVVIALALVAWGMTHRADGRSSVTFDCGRDDCRWRGRVNHRHQLADSHRP